MCGIIGYIGRKPALPILIDGLQNLEYRGYDSCGVVVFDEFGRAQVAKAVGKISRLADSFREKGFKGSVGCGHTRWATHGAVTEANAHPHTDCRKEIYIVHNGTIDNFDILKVKLEKNGHKFRSDTDTEVIAHLIEEFYRDPTTKLEEAVRSALGKIDGTYGLVVISVREPYKMVAACYAGSLLLGFRSGDCIVASDPNPISVYTDRAIEISDGEMAIVFQDRYILQGIDGSEVRDRQMRLLKEIPEEIKRGRYPHYMLKEIFDQPEAVRRSISGRIDLAKFEPKLGGIERVIPQLCAVGRFWLVGCGTAYYAALLGKHFLERYARIPAEADLASEFRYRQPIFLPGDVLLAVSQSGETADTLAAVHIARQAGILTMGIVNRAGSKIARVNDCGIYQHIGPEIAVASTKAFSSQVVILSLLAVLLGQKRGIIKSEQGRKILESIKALPDKIEEILQQNLRIRALAQEYVEQGYKSFLYLGRGKNYPVALEGALKLKEISYLHAEGYAAGEMKHGPIALVDGKNGYPVVVIATNDEPIIYEKTLSNMQEVKARGARILAIASEGDRRIKYVADDVIFIPNTHSICVPVLAVAPLQLFAYYAAVQLGYDPDKPRNLAKSVTVE